MCHEDLEAIYDLGQRDRAVTFPFVERFGIVDIHDKILFLALKMNLGLRSVSAHVDDVAGEQIILSSKMYLLEPSPDIGSERVKRVNKADRQSNQLQFF